MLVTLIQTAECAIRPHHTPQSFKFAENSRIMPLSKGMLLWLSLLSEELYQKLSTPSKATVCLLSTGRCGYKWREKKPLLAGKT